MANMMFNIFEKWFHLCDMFFGHTVDIIEGTCALVLFCIVLFVVFSGVFHLGKKAGITRRKVMNYIFVGISLIVSPIIALLALSVTLVQVTNKNKKVIKKLFRKNLRAFLKIILR